MTKHEALTLALEALEWINRVNAMEYEYQQKARESLNAIYDALAEQPAQQQEPVAMYEDWYNPKSCGHCGMVGGHIKTCRHYTTPPQRNPLTDEEIVAINDKYYNIAYRDFEADVAIARAIEQAHGIKENT